MIVKLQRALFPPEAANEVLIYFEDDHLRIPAMIQITDPEIVKLLGEDAKGYFEARFDRADGTVSLVIGDRVPDQEW